MINLIVLSHNNFDYTTKKCLASLVPQLEDKYSLTVVDNNSHAESRNNLIEHYQENNSVDLIFSKKNLGFAGGMNLGVKHTKGEWLVLINSDTYFYKDCLSIMSKYLQITQFDVIGFLTNAAGTAQEIIKSDDDVFIKNTAEYIHKNPSNIEIPLIRADFFCCAIRRECWDSLHGFDEIYGLGYYEDIDFSERAKKAGFRVGMTEDIFIAHTGGASFKGFSNDQKKLIKKNKAIFTKRFPDSPLLNTRDDNLEALNYYLRLLEHGNISNSMLHRLSLRLKRADENIPRSFFKKRGYKKKLMKIKESLEHYI